MIRWLGRLSVVAGIGLAVAALVDRWLGGKSRDDDGRTLPDPIRSEVEIGAPIELVWAELADIERQPRWMHEMKTVRLLTPGPVGVGTRGEAEVRILGIAVVDPVEVTEFLPPHRFAIRHEGAFSGAGLIRLEALEDHRTRLIWDETLVPPVLPNLLALGQAPILGRIFQADLERFRSIVEARPGARPGAAHAGSAPADRAGAGPTG